MTKRRAGRRSLGRHGVKVLLLKNGRHVARWTNPVSLKQEQEGLTELGLTNAEEREKWARAKAKEIATTRASITSGESVLGLVTVATAIEDWLKTFAHGPTRSSYAMLVARFGEWTTARGIVHMQDIVAAHLPQFATDYAAGAAFAPLTGAKRGKKGATSRRRKASTVALAMRVVRQFLQAQRKRGLTPRLTSDAIKERLEGPAVPKGEIRFLRPHEIQELLRAAMRHDRDEPENPRHRAGAIAPFVMAVLLSGARFDEIASLEWKEVDLKSGEIRLPASRTKTREARTIRLDVSPMLQRLLERMRITANGAELVFAMERGRAEFARRRMVSEFASPMFTWHTLRRTAGTVLTNAPGIFGAASAWAAAKRAGHSVQIAEATYVGVLHDLPAAARTIEAAAGIEAECNAIVASVGGVVATGDAGDATAAAVC
jgi:integrase